MLHFCYTYYMPTIKQRINITADKEMGVSLRNAAKRDKMSVSSKAVELLRLALNIEEDHVLATIARERDTHGVKYVPHDKFWKEILGK